MSAEIHYPPRGARIGSRVVVREGAPDGHGRKRVLMRCDCGAERLVLLARVHTTMHGNCCNRRGAKLLFPAGLA